MNDSELVQAYVDAHAIVGMLCQFAPQARGPPAKWTQREEAVTAMTAAADRRAI
jgi:hypothetical protein